VPVLCEFDLASWWDDRPLLAITGTDGKTTVTTLVRDMLVASGLAAVAVGNTPVPLVAATDDPAADVSVVDASSFRLAHSQRFAPAVGTWLNFAPDHHDSHPDSASYEAPKAGIWRDQSSDRVAVGNADDPVARHLAGARARHVTFALAADADFRLVRDVAPGGRLTVLLVPTAILAACGSSSGGKTFDPLTEESDQTEAAATPEREEVAGTDLTHAVPFEDIVFDTFDGGSIPLSAASDEQELRLRDAIVPIDEPVTSMRQMSRGCSNALIR
jgi:hypothetical protein